MRFIGTKIIIAEAMTRAAYVAFRGWQLPANENGADAGYLVEYEPDGKPNVPGRDGYVTWTPKAAFDNAYRPCEAMNFGLALEALKRGHRVARAGWNGKGMWIALSGSTTNPRNIAWENFWSKQASAFARDENGGGAEVLPCILMKTADNRILMGWLASQTDMLADDWQIVEAVETKTYADGTKATGLAPLPATSPADTSDAAIESEIQAKGKTAPRVTPADIEANIADEVYFTAYDGASGAATSRNALFIGNNEINTPLLLLTFCVLVLKNGFTVTGESACASPENFDAEIGRKVARQNAVQKIWPLMGYQLKQHLANQ